MFVDKTNSNRLIFLSPSSSSINSYSNTKVYINCTPSRSIVRRNGSAPNQASSPLLTPLHSANNNGHGNGSAVSIGSRGSSVDGSSSNSTNSSKGYLLSPLNSPKPGRRSLNSVGSASSVNTGGGVGGGGGTPHRQASLNENSTNASGNDLLSGPGRDGTGNGTSVPPSPNSQPYWKSRLNNLKNSFLLGTPR